jgi:hypothetical protein
MLLLFFVSRTHLNCVCRAAPVPRVEVVALAPRPRLAGALAVVPRLAVLVLALWLAAVDRERDVVFLGGDSGSSESICTSASESEGSNWGVLGLDSYCHDIIARVPECPSVRVSDSRARLLASSGAICTHQRFLALTTRRGLGPALGLGHVRVLLHPGCQRKPSKETHMLSSSAMLSTSSDAAFFLLWSSQIYRRAS